jgi:hypothetical protein
MAVKLRRSSFEYAKHLIRTGRFVFDERDAWSKDQPSTSAENEFIAQNGFDAYARWHLAVDDDEPEDARDHYKFPYGDFVSVHRCAVLSAESRAGQYHYLDIEHAVAHLHGMLDASDSARAVPH